MLCLRHCGTGEAAAWTYLCSIATVCKQPALCSLTLNDDDFHATAEAVWSERREHAAYFLAWRDIQILSGQQCEVCTFSWGYLNAVMVKSILKKSTGLDLLMKNSCRFKVFNSICSKYLFVCCVLFLFVINFSIVFVLCSNWYVEFVLLLHASANVNVPSEVNCFASCDHR